MCSGNHLHPSTHTQVIAHTAATDRGFAVATAHVPHFEGAVVCAGEHALRVRSERAGVHFARVTGQHVLCRVEGEAKGKKKRESKEHMSDSKRVLPQRYEWVQMRSNLQADVTFRATKCEPYYRCRSPSPSYRLMKTKPINTAQSTK
jgi:hypothetical protein